MKSGPKHQAWFLDQLTKSAFFHQKLHEWKMLTLAEEIDRFQGERLDWNLSALGISEVAWKRVIHRGIKPVTVFAHPEVLTAIPGALGYYRMLAMVSQKSMRNVGLTVDRYEAGLPIQDGKVAEKIAVHLNFIISRLIEFDEQVNDREFDLWRGIAAGAQAQGSWQNAKGTQTELAVKGLIRRRLYERDWIAQEMDDGTRLELSDGRVVVFANEPDIAFYKGGQIRTAVEVKGGIDPAGVLERLGAALKSLNRIREENPTAITILIVQGVSMTPQARHDLEINRHIVTHWFTVEDLLANEAIRGEIFELLNI